MNTALLTGVPQPVPVKLVVVETGGAVSEVTEQMGCESSNKQVLQVRESGVPHKRCVLVYPSRNEISSLPAKRSLNSRVPHCLPAALQEGSGIHLVSLPYYPSCSPASWLVGFP